MTSIDLHSLVPGLYIAVDPRYWSERDDIDWSEPFTVIGHCQDHGPMCYRILSSQSIITDTFITAPVRKIC